MKITTDDVTHVAALANLDVPEGEAETLAEQLTRIVDYVEKLNHLDTDDIPPTTQVVQTTGHHERPDKVEPRAGSGVAGETVQFFKVPRVISGR
jgi:aspartyl-tRNA(Asn)/glutamyl-tRNA(Gln) amidotransferase subunit C